MSRRINFEDESRNGLKKGVDALANAVKVTLGPKGRNVIIKRQFQLAKITKDGVSVALEVELEDDLENLGVEIVREVASKTNELAGDGTTTATVLAQSIITEGLKNVAAGSDPIELKRGIDKAVKVVVKGLNSQAKEINGIEDIKKVATISANNDVEVGETISKAIEKVGKNGMLTVQEAQGTSTYIDHVEGMKFNRGYESHLYVTNKKDQTAVLKDPFILLINEPLLDLTPLVPIFEEVSTSKKSLIIIAKDFSEEVTGELVLNKMQHQFKVVAVKAPGFGDQITPLLEDLAIQSGGVVFSKETGTLLEMSNMNMLGRADKVIVSKDNTTITNGLGAKEKIDERIEELEVLISDKNRSEFETINNQNRLAKLKNGIAVIFVGGNSPLEKSELKDRYDDAVNATKAAIEEGVVAGGGVALIKTKKALIDFVEKEKSLTTDQVTGVAILSKALQAPLMQIVENGGGFPEVVFNEVYKSKGNLGYDAKLDEYVDMIKAGIIDPVKVTRIALEKAASISSMVLTTECTIIEEKKDAPKNPLEDLMGGMKQ